jgi:hypothetical protein
MAPLGRQITLQKSFRNLPHQLQKRLLQLSKWGGISFCVWRIQVAVGDLAGKETIAKGDIRFDAAAKLDFFDLDGTKLVLGGLVVGGIGIVYGVQQSKLRRRVVERLNPYKEKYETLIDPGRKSSKLTTTGDTRPEDK